MSPPDHSPAEIPGDSAVLLAAQLARQRAAFLQDPFPTARVRRDRLARAIAMLTAARPRIIAAIDADFGGRAATISTIADILAPLTSLKHAKRHVRRWMRDEKRAPEFPMALFGVKAWITFQPVGVVGVMSPWNAPFALSLTPLAGILAAGNRAMLKPSELSPHSSALLAEIIGATFSPEEVCVMQGGVETARAFSALPFDHLLYTGGSATARHVMRAAAANLTPVTLELGGKSPAIIGMDADINDAASKILGGKLSNGGQICMCPDHAWVPAGQLEAFVAGLIAAGQRMVPSIAGNPDMTAVLGARAQARLRGAIDEAHAAGARILPLGTPDPDRPGIVVPTLVIDPPDNWSLNAQEVFGPILPVRSYTSLSALIDQINAGPVPLAAYFFGRNTQEIASVQYRLRAGGMTLGDVMLHPFMQNLPFGGLGESGMGRYVGGDGFKTFSHHKSFVRRGWLDIGKYLQPPYSAGLRKMLDLVTRR